MTRFLQPYRYALIVTLSTIATTLALPGCSDSKAPEDTAAVPPVRRAEAPAEPEVLLPRELRRRLKANEKAQFERSGTDIVEAHLFQSGVKSIKALKGLPLRTLDLGMTEVSDLSPIAGMPLRTLDLENTPVADLSVLKGMQLEVVRLQNTKVTDLSVLADMPIRELNLMGVPIDDLTAIANLPLQTLWIPRSKVTDISPLQGKAMVSLDVEATEVSSLAPLAGMSTLRRLNIAGTPIKDVSPLQGLKLERITLTPENIDTGMEVLRSMPSLSQILTSMQGPGQSAADFWTKYDQGVWREQPDIPATKPVVDEDKSDPAASTDNSPPQETPDNKLPPEEPKSPDAAPPKNGEPPSAADVKDEGSASPDEKK